MSKPAEDLAPDLPFTRPVAVAGLDRTAGLPLEIALEGAEAARLAAFLDVVAVEGLGFTGSLAPWRERGWRLSGRLSAVLVQRCVVSLDPVRQDMVLDLERHYLPRAEAPTPVEIEVGPEEADLPDSFDEAIEIAAAITETLALDRDPYPRKPGVELGARAFAPPGVTPLTDEDLRPFAKLATLKEKLAKGSG